MGRASKGNSWCRHRTPIDKVQFPVCKAGVDYHKFNGGPAGNGKSMLPCFGDCAKGIAQCDKYSAYTPEEIAASEADFELRFARIGVIRNAIVQQIAATKVRGGQIPCPCCKTGTVGYSQASNGHIHARCTTKDCASWME